jgi:hypothetical protein
MLLRKTSPSLLSPPFHRRRPVARAQQRHLRRAVPSEIVLPVFVDVVARYLCHGRVEGCLDGLAVPAVEQQILLLRAMHQIAMQTDIEGLQATFIRLLLDQNVDAVEQLLRLAIQYNTAKDSIRDMVEAVQMVHLAGMSA